MHIPMPRAALAALILALAACGQRADEKQPAAAKAASQALPVSVVEAEPREIERTVLASGPVEAWEEMQLGVELNGLRVTSLNVDVGQQVEKGEVLLELDHRTLDAELRQAEAALAEAEAGVELAKVNLARGEALLSRKLVSNADWDQLRSAVVQSRARAATTRAQRDAAKLRRDFATLRAPDDGIVSKRMVQPGQVVAAGTELLRLIRQARLEWRAELAEADLARVAPGAAVEIVVDGQKVAGTVRAVTPGLDPTTRTGMAKVDLPDPGPLRQGAFVDGRIVTGRSSALMLPAISIVQRDGYPYVFTVDAKGVVARVRVRTGAQSGDWIEVLDGLEAGRAVVAQGAGFLSEGDRVRVVEATAQQ
ncbi:MAG TPA: efflux RND transporter periplasmic adaptor subunit [Xanthomonadales bacterium]|nr:efflux RND transporter periplasmic adaptor subunit [Xanthomonadales bacterium]